MEYTSLSDYCKETFGEKLYKLSLDSGCTCPNRDGLLDTRGCLFCSAGGSGDFAAARNPLDRQLEEAKRRIRNKFPEGDSEEGRYIAYVQSFTGTYPGKDGFVKDANGVSSFDRMRKRYLALVQRPEVRVLSIATRPDCLGPEALDLLKELRAIKPVWVELGLQTSNEETAEYIRRCYRNEVYEQAVQNLNALDIPVITHVILGLPGETKEDMATTVRYAVDCGTWGIKLQLLHVLEGTDLGEQYKAQEAGTPLPGARPIRIMTLDEYTDLLCALLPLIPRDVVIHRITGDGPKRLLLAPLWSGDKKRVLNTINKAIRELKV
ncbi:MAG: TIGR01212 family radical SAM protein [Clostridiales bacterium]|nr:TIGR01212 family radical SAM protein [Clostridia bacterium]MBQ8083169.1 TIGR01212 family radical SAM protein [Clostridia bacterium]MEE1292102.1 TIGR01212 family radical SAM protein [Acutalibacteraceae bacterium]NLD29911.1 TIGR01212 family radical SAM protein [Clostridiales bacterium]